MKVRLCGRSDVCEVASLNLFPRVIEGDWHEMQFPVMVPP